MPASVMGAPANLSNQPPARSRFEPPPFDARAYFAL
jgi:hypothetical protein